MEDFSLDGDDGYPPGHIPESTTRNGVDRPRPRYYHRNGYSDTEASERTSRRFRKLDDSKSGYDRGPRSNWWKWRWWTPQTDTKSESNPTTRIMVQSRSETRKSSSESYGLDRLGLSFTSNGSSKCDKEVQCTLKKYHTRNGNRARNGYKTGSGVSSTPDSTTSSSAAAFGFSGQKVKQGLHEVVLKFLSQFTVGSCCHRSGYQKRKETERRIRANDPAFNAQFNYANNYIKTSRYSILTFLPLNLFEQFQRLANFYFLCLLILQFIPLISSLTYVTTLVPLVVVLLLTAIKDAIDDIQRHRNDSTVNNRKSFVLRDSRLVDERWYKVQVGDVIRMENDQFVAADLLLLSTSEPNGLCYIETAELDGETNLKCRQCLPETADLGEDSEAIGKFDGEIVCEPPNNNLNKFEGRLTYDGEVYALDKDKVLLRGCVLRNTKWCYGVVIFAGRDTKLMQNSGKTVFKRTSIDRLLNWLILGIVFFLFSMCLFCTIACGIWETVTGFYFQDYLPHTEEIPKESTSGAAVIALLVFFSYAIVLNTVVPISLYVSVEIIRLGHSFWINWDDLMYYEKTNTYAKARTTTLNEELGQIEYIFSDKTGTLTQNIMSFNKCTIAGRCYGDVIDEKTGEMVDVNENTPTVDFSANPMHEAEFRWYDPLLLDAVRRGDREVFTFFRVLALCHTVMPDEKDGKLEYQAQSPDEAALTSAARNFGFVFKERSPNSITIDVMGQTEVYELLCILDFNNVRKRMSVILRRNGKLRLYCKGADSVIYERLDPKVENNKTSTTEHLNKFAGEGLRTLCLAVKDVDDAFFEQWKKKYHEASIAMENREEKLDEVYEEVEQDLILAGATAIEDKLQDGVPQTIANLARADIKLWVLTGDKQETAINIGYSCQLLTDEMVDVFIVDGHEYDEVKGQLERFRESIYHIKGVQTIANSSSHLAEVGKRGFGTSTSLHEPSRAAIITFSDSNDVQVRADHVAEHVTISADAAGGFALILNGFSLVHALNPKMELLFLDVASQCKSVICCRVTPLQKAMVVDLVKRHKKAVTLAIGDGANDVSMIKTAHIGVGISGQEGMQAVLASDFSIAQFRYLERLLLVHGRWSYLRMCKFLRYFFYKNFAFTLCHFWFAFFCGFSAQTLYDPMFISCYNVFYTSLPVLALGIFDQDVNDRFSIRYPQLYKPGHLNLFFNKREFLKSVAHGVISSFVLFFVPYFVFKEASTSHGVPLSDLQVFGTAVSSILVIVVSLQVALDTAYWTFMNHIVIWGSIIFYFASTWFINAPFLRGAYLGSIQMIVSTPVYWLTLVITLTILIVPVIVWRFYFMDTRPTLSDQVRLRQRFSSRTRTRSTETMLRTPSSRRSRRSLRSGYAFAHQEGFGRLITSGKIMQRRNKAPAALAAAVTSSLATMGEDSGGVTLVSARGSNVAETSVDSRDPTVYSLRNSRSPMSVYSHPKIDT